jgi:L-threonylcarbamoyladenylate synthase
MTTLVLAVDPFSPDPSTIASAVEVLRGGGLVAFPTETVYGLGASALDTRAVARIFAAKGRPANNPLIVHVWDAEAARSLTATWPEAAARLAQRFWPGPLTLVLPKRDHVPAIVTAGGPTVAVRVPAHPVALALLHACQLPLAAPSANRSSRLSPTRGQHVLRDLDGRIDMLLDAGPTSGGLESTVLDLAGPKPRLLRPGLIVPAEIEAIVGPLSRARSSPETTLRSPGLLEKHYSPRTPLECTDEASERIHRLAEQGLRLGLLTYRAEAVPAGAQIVVLPEDAQAYAAGLYAALHELDAAGLDRILVTLPPDTEEWLAVRDRLCRAAHQPGKSDQSG